MNKLGSIISGIAVALLVGSPILGGTMELEGATASDQQVRLAQAPLKKAVTKEEQEKAAESEEQKPLTSRVLKPKPASTESKQVTAKPQPGLRAPASAPKPKIIGKPKVLIPEKTVAPTNADGEDAWGGDGGEPTTGGRGLQAPGVMDGGTKGATVGKAAAPVEKGGATAEQPAAKAVPPAARTDYRDRRDTEKSLRHAKLPEKARQSWAQATQGGIVRNDAAAQFVGMFMGAQAGADVGSSADSGQVREWNEGAEGFQEKGFEQQTKDIDTPAETSLAEADPVTGLNKPIADLGRSRMEQYGSRIEDKSTEGYTEAGAKPIGSPMDQFGSPEDKLSEGGSQGGRVGSQGGGTASSGGGGSVVAISGVASGARHGQFGTIEQSGEEAAMETQDELGSGRSALDRDRPGKVTSANPGYSGATRSRGWVDFWGSDRGKAVKTASTVVAGATVGVVIAVAAPAALPVAIPLAILATATNILSAWGTAEDLNKDKTPNPDNDSTPRTAESLEKAWKARLEASKNQFGLGQPAPDDTAGERDRELVRFEDPMARRLGTQIQTPEPEPDQPDEPKKIGCAEVDPGCNDPRPIQ